MVGGRGLEPPKYVGGTSFEEAHDDVENRREETREKGSLFHKGECLKLYVI